MVKHSVKYNWKFRKRHFAILQMQKNFVENLTRYRMRQLADTYSVYKIHWTNDEIASIHSRNPLSENGAVASPPTSDAL